MFHISLFRYFTYCTEWPLAASYSHIMMHYNSDSNGNFYKNINHCSPRKKCDQQSWSIDTWLDYCYKAFWMFMIA